MRFGSPIMVRAMHSPISCAPSSLDLRAVYFVLVAAGVSGEERIGGDERKLWVGFGKQCGVPSVVPHMQRHPPTPVPCGSTQPISLETADHCVPSEPS